MIIVVLFSISYYKQELLADVQSHEDQFKSLASTAQSLLIDMEGKECDSGEFSAHLTQLKSTWADVHSILTGFHTQLEKECEELNSYLEKLGDFSERLNAVYAEFYDELCTAIPPNASQETINRQKQVLEVCLRRRQWSFFVCTHDFTVCALELVLVWCLGLYHCCIAYSAAL